MNEHALLKHYQRGYYEGAEQYFADQGAPVDADHRVLAREIAKLCGRGKRASLDIGCGGGQLVQAFAEQGFTATGTELSEAACRTAARLGRNVLNTDTSCLPDEGFDCVTAMHVLEHAPQPQRFLGELHRLARPGGVVVIEVPNFGCRTSKAMGAKWAPLYPDTHLFHYTPKTLHYAIESNGLTPLRTRRLGGRGFLGQQPPIKLNVHAGVGAPSGSHLRPRMSWKAALWRMRSPVLKLPGMRPLLRWIAWEVLGHGEYVRVIARKPAG